jgi:hypothetical protein
MALFGAIIANNYIIHPYVSLFFEDASVMLAIPPDMWSLLKIGIGGYVVGRSVEKISTGGVTKMIEKVSDTFKS